MKTISINKIVLCVFAGLLFCAPANAAEVSDEEYRTIALHIVDKVIALQKKYRHFIDANLKNISPSLDKLPMQFNYSHS